MEHAFRLKIMDYTVVSLRVYHIRRASCIYACCLASYKVGIALFLGMFSNFLGHSIGTQNNHMCARNHSFKYVFSTYIYVFTSWIVSIMLPVISG